jgi:hypothetical protein
MAGLLDDPPSLGCYGGQDGLLGLKLNGTPKMHEDIKTLEKERVSRVTRLQFGFVVSTAFSCRALRLQLSIVPFISNHPKIQPTIHQSIQQTIHGI